MERGIDRRMGAASAVINLLSKSVVVTLSIYRSIDYVSTLTCCHEVLVMTGRMGLRIRAAERCSLRRGAGCTLRNRVSSSVPQEELWKKDFHLF